MFNVNIQHDFCTMQKRIFVSRKVGKDREFLTGGKWKKVEAGLFNVDSDFFKADSPEFDAFIQALVDEAWNAGYRPKEHVGVGSELAATKYHLEDMRNLTQGIFDRLNIKLKK